MIEVPSGGHRLAPARDVLPGPGGAPASPVSGQREHLTGRSGHRPSPDYAVAEERAHALAVRVVAGQSTDAHDCAELLAMLGLNVDLARR